jgi:hypothetical protein
MVTKPEKLASRQWQIPTAHTGNKQLITDSSSQILGLAEFLIAQEVTLVVMEATSSYWKPFVRHEAHGDIPRVAGADSEGGRRV